MFYLSFLLVIISRTKKNSKLIRQIAIASHRIATHSKSAFLHSNITADQVSRYASLGQAMNRIAQKDAFSQNYCAVDSQI